MKTLIMTIVTIFSVGALAHNSTHIEKVNQEVSNIQEAQADCLDKAMSNVGMKICVAETYGSLDDLLNKEYKDIVKNKSNFDHGEDTKTILEEDFRKSQRAWLKFRDANCSWKSNDMFGGTGQSLIHMSCSNDMTQKRIVEIVEEYYYEY